MRLNHPVYSPFDIRVTLRIVAALLIWKTLSTDYTNLIELARTPRPVFMASFMQVEVVNSTLTRFADKVYVSSMAIRGIQIGICVILGVSVALLNRWLVLAALVPVWAFHCYASFFLAPLFECELCLCYLFLAALWPGSWTNLVLGGYEVTPASTTFGCTVLAMVGMWYFFAGLSKLLFDLNWVTNVHLEHLLPTFMVRVDAVPGWHGIGQRVHGVVTATPWLGTAAAAVVLVSELLFPLAVISRWTRWIVVPGMAGLHIGFFLASSTLFLVSIVLLFSIVTPWRRLGRAVRTTGPQPVSDGRFMARGAAVVAVLLALHTLCAVKSRNYFPVVNWNVFGWRYADMSAPVDIYHIGYRDPADGQIKSIPHNRGGFLDYRSVGFCRNLANAYYQAKTDAERVVITRQARNFLAALRPEYSNRWLLGPLTFPNHVVIDTEPTDVTMTGEFFFMKGRARFVDDRIVKEWERMEKIE
jgi:hypothetical protein